MSTVKMVRMYGFNDLDDTAKAIAISKEREFRTTVDTGWQKEIEHQLRTFLELQGMDFLDLRWSGFYNQGDGASIICSFTKEDVPQKVVPSEEFMEIVAKNCPMFRQQVSFWNYVEGSNPPSTSFLELVRMLKVEDFKVWTYPFTHHYYHDKTITADSIHDLESDDLDQIDLDQIRSVLEYLRSNFLVWVAQLSRFVYCKMEMEFDDISDEKNLVNLLKSYGDVFDSHGNNIGHLEIR